MMDEINLIRRDAYEHSLRQNIIATRSRHNADPLAEPLVMAHKGGSIGVSPGRTSPASAMRLTENAGDHDERTSQSKRAGHLSQHESYR